METKCQIELLAPVIYTYVQQKVANGLVFMLIFISWVFLSLVVGAYGSSKNVSVGFLGSFIVSLLFSPIIGFIAVAVSKPDEKKLIRSGMKKCPYCAELVKGEAVVCKHCGKEFPPSAPPPETPGVLWYCREVINRFFSP